MGFSARVRLLVLVIASAPSMAVAQPPEGSSPAAASAATTAAAAGTAGAEGATTAPVDADVPSAPASAKPVVPATGYSYRGPAAPSEGARGRTVRADPASSDAQMPGFETRADGSTRLFVQLSKAVSFDARSSPSAVTVVLKGARVDRRNNQNPLVTVHFNTPVTSARLVPHGRDVWFVVDLRANVQPATSMVATKVGSALLSMEFPKGQYLPAGLKQPPPPADSAGAATSTEALATTRGTASAKSAPAPAR
jgi:hypothetical protein